MSNKNARWYLLLPLLLVLGLLIWRGSGQRGHDWGEQYRPEQKGPYELWLLERLLSKGYGGRPLRHIETDLAEQLDAAGPGADYLFVGPGMYMDSSDTQALLRFVEAGRSAFIASKELPYDLMFFLYYDECPGAPWEGFQRFSDTSVALLLPALPGPLPLRFRTEAANPAPYDWAYFPAAYFCGAEGGLEALGHCTSSRQDDGERYANFVRVPYGQGFFYLHSQPLAFTNYSLQAEAALAYTEQVLAPLRGEGELLWDDYSRISEAFGRSLNQRRQGRDLAGDSPLKHLLAQPAMAWAWYTLLGAGLLYVLLRGKRRQRVVPVLPGNANTSLEYVESIGGIYFRYGDHLGLSEQQMRYFLHELRERYGYAQREHDAAALAALSQRSTVPPEAVQLPFRHYQAIRQAGTCDEAQMLALYEAIRQFWAKAR